MIKREVINRFDTARKGHPVIWTAFSAYLYYFFKRPYTLYDKFQLILLLMEA
jgi:hypothetical protein